MAVRIQLAGTALARVRFAISPVFETVMAVDALHRPGSCAVHLPWVSWARGRLGEIPDLPLLRALLAHELKPAYLMPVPDDRMPDLDAELGRVRSTRSAQVWRDLDRRGERLPRPLRDLRAEPRAGLARVVAAIRACHQVLLSSYWPRMVRVLEADIGHRARLLADGGIEAVFADLHRDVTWTDGELWLHAGNRPDQPFTVDLTRHGLMMSPSVFAWPRTWTDTRPVGTGIVRYPARGIASVWETTNDPAPEALEALVGRTRARLLGLLAVPATTPDLAVRLQVTPGAVSQHLTVLRNAGLVATHRQAHTVIHLRTTSGDALVQRR